MTYVLKSISRTINNFDVQLTIERRKEGYYDGNGVWQEPCAEEFCIMGSIQPLSDRDLNLLPEGSRESESKKIYTQEKLRTADAPADLPADVVVYKDRKYEVHQVQDWEDFGCYYRVIAIKMRERRKK